MALMDGYMYAMMTGSSWPLTTFSGFWLFGLLLLVIVFAALIDIMQRKDLDSGKRVGWVLIVIMGGFFSLSILGAIVYFVWGRRK